jgi:alkanesulfonate monooxygenase SsuD/methylene tetrahydromethanopterin reductase-like flavin-dependent oxidoreductase (luciferase family)
VDRALRFGLELPPLPAGRAGEERGSTSVTDAALAAEQAGIGALWLVESFPVGLDPVPLAGALAAVTGSIGIGLRLRPGHGRHPSVVARDATTLDLLSHGRALVALMEDGAGPLDLERLGEAVALVRRLLSEEEVTETGRFYAVAELTIRPRPFRPGGPPVVAGVLTEPPGQASVEEVVARAGAAAHVLSGPFEALAASRLRLDAVSPAGARPQLLWRGELPGDSARAAGTVRAVLDAGADGLIAVVPDAGSDLRRRLIPVLDALAPFASR